ncbi:MAG TPA: hypothetical protein PKE29_17140 [Phycisphaerales bacterium]|nr:hypothetical protein [Phycisphaerales bacterium]
MDRENPDIVSPSEFQRDFAAIARKAQRGGRVVVRKERTSLAVVSTRLLDRLLEDASDKRVIARRRSEPSVPWNKVKSRLGL